MIETLWYLASFSLTNNPCHSIIHASGSRYAPDNYCERTDDYDSWDENYTCIVRVDKAQYTCNINIHDRDCPYRAIDIAAINALYSNLIITTLKEKTHE